MHTVHVFFHDYHTVNTYHDASAAQAAFDKIVTANADAAYDVSAQAIVCYSDGIFYNSWQRVV